MGFDSYIVGLAIDLTSTITKISCSFILLFEWYDKILKCQEQRLAVVTLDTLKSMDINIK